jgi:peptidoglycan/LPS O-acetylase OafA/YrhL
VQYFYAFYAGFPQVLLRAADSGAVRHASKRDDVCVESRITFDICAPILTSLNAPDSFMREVRHVKGLDGLRAIAVVLVFLSHKAHVLAIDVGKLGVWTFFFISGFLIVGELHRNRLAVERGTVTRRHAFALFLVKRALRIFPVYYLLLAALAIAHALFYQRGVNLGLAWHALFLSDYWIGIVKDGWPGTTSHFWSLAVEQQFYLIAPLALLATPAARHITLCIVAVALCAAAHLGLYLANASPVLIYAFSPWNFALIALGGLAAMALADRDASVPRRGPPWWLGAAGVAFFLVLPACTELPNAVEGLVDLGLSASLGSLLLWIVNEPDHPAVALLEWAPLVYLGTISYGFYLFHNLIPAHFGVMPSLYQRAGLPQFVQDVLTETLQFLLAVLLAHLSWRYLEKRLLDYKKPLAAMLARHFATPQRTSAR